MSDRFRVDSAYEEGGDEQYVITPLPDAPPASLSPPPPDEPPRIGASTAVAFSCEYEGAISGLMSSIFRLRVLNDATLAGDVLRPHKPRSNNGGCKRQHKRPKLSTLMVMRSNGDTGSAAAVDRDGMVVYARLQGRAKPIPSALNSHRQAHSLRSNDAYCCYFDVLPDPQRHSEDDEEEEEAITCHVHFSPQKDDLRGHWVPHSEKPFWITGDAPCELYYQEIKQAFQLKRRAVAVKPEAGNDADSRSTALKHEDPNLKTEDRKQQLHENDSARLKLYPLTPGLYEFRGFSTIAPAPRSSRTMTTTPASPSRRRQRSRSDFAQPTKDECFVTLRLLPGGALKGTSRELLRPQSCKVTGTWRADRVRYTLEYQVRGEVGLFRYSGRIEGDRKVLGKWKNVDEGHQEGYDGGKGEFELELTQAARLSQLKKSTGAGVDQETVELDDDDDDGLAVITNNRIRVLTTGVFTLKGCATDDDGYEYACELVVHLLPGGSLVGTSRELVFDQTHRIEGTWTPRSLSYDQKYVVKGDVGEYEYAGVVDADGGIISGLWNNKEVQDQETLGEKGTFAYGIVEAHRVWTAFSHLWYPQSYQKGVMLMLLCSSRTHTLPSSLWYHVLEFCHESWFVCQKTAAAGAVITKLEV
ncbi:hypothetical protein Gpo141_00006539 [Globisporangium polare]